MGHSRASLLSRSYNRYIYQLFYGFLLFISYCTHHCLINPIAVTAKIVVVFDVLNHALGFVHKTRMQQSCILCLLWGHTVIIIIIIIIKICSAHISTLLGAQGAETKKKHEYKQFTAIAKTKL